MRRHTPTNALIISVTVRFLLREWRFFFFVCVYVTNDQENFRVAVFIRTHTHQNRRQNVAGCVRSSRIRIVTVYWGRELVSSVRACRVAGDRELSLVHGQEIATD